MILATAFPEVNAVIESARALGSRRLDDGTELIGHVPHVAPEAWLHILFPALTPEEIRQVEAEIGRPLGPTFSSVLAMHNGLSLFSDSLYIYGHRKSVRRTGAAVRQPFSIRTPNTLERPKDAAPSHLFVGGYESDGSHLYIDLRDSRVCRCTRRSAAPLNAWDDFFGMLNSEARRLATLFDSQGRRTASLEALAPAPKA
ncbi:MAG: SMI1/KNR4 family protein [Gemmatimonadota bacterium]|nr:SMI1/KNR4 family protein [Gemmatimonadota bacterium]